MNGKEKSVTVRLALAPIEKLVRMLFVVPLPIVPAPIVILGDIVALAQKADVEVPQITTFFICKVLPLPPEKYNLIESVLPLDTGIDKPDILIFCGVPLEPPEMVPVAAGTTAVV